MTKAVPGLVVLLCIATGVAGLWIGLYAVERGDRTAAGSCLIAAALAFGLLSNALFRR